MAKTVTVIPSCAVLGGTIWEEISENNLQDPSETSQTGSLALPYNTMAATGVENVVVYLFFENGEHVLDSDGNPLTSTTDALGNYSFPGIFGGSYYVQITNLPSGFQLVTENMGSNDNLDSDINPYTFTSDIITLTNTEAAYSLDAGIFHTLPIQLKTYRADAKDCTVKLYWTTSAEKDNAGFEIERSIDGINFTKIKALQGVGNSVEDQHYSTSDVATQDAYYYRLVQIDIDGTRNISATIFVKTDCAAFKTEGINALYPNPINGAQKMTLKYTSNNSIAGKLTVIDIHGKIVLNNVVELREGINSFYVDIENLVNGIYFVKIENDKTQINNYKKFVKLD